MHDVGQYVGNRAEKLRGNLLVNAGGVINCPRQRRKFHHLDIVISAHFTDPERNIVDSFSNDVRGFGTLWIIFQRNGVMRRVGDDNVCRWYGSCDLPHRHLTLKLADASFNLWITVIVFILFFHFLFGHAHFFGEHELTERYIQQGENDDNGDEVAEDVTKNGKPLSDRLTKIKLLQVAAERAWSHAPSCTTR
ncbi:Uncharacterised protein [Citrobacter koseri]|nr:Uncharacterised protein [Citrobacter koseri]